VEELAAELIEHRRRGQHPLPTEYTDRYPGHAEAIRSRFPALMNFYFRVAQVAACWQLLVNRL
jgi:hypothetical protein